MDGFLEREVKVNQKDGLIAILAEKIKRQVKKLVNLVGEVLVRKEQSIHIVGRRHLIVAHQKNLVKNLKQEKKDSRHENYEITIKANYQRRARQCY